MAWVCVAPEFVCLCPSPIEMVKSGALNIVEAVQFGISNIDEVADAATNYVDRNINQLKNEIGESIETLSDISSDLFDKFLQPAIDKLLEWLKFMFESIFEGAKYILGEITEGVYAASKFIYKLIFKLCLGEGTVEEVVRDVLDKLCEILGTDLDSIETYLSNTEPFSTIITLFETLKEITDVITSVVTAPQRFLEDLADEYVRPFVVDYFGDLLPLDAIPIDGIEDLILNVAVDNLVINLIGQLFGDVTAGMKRAMNNIVEFLVNMVSDEIMGDGGAGNNGVPQWSLEVTGVVLALSGVVVGFLGFHDKFSAATSGVPGQVGTALGIVGLVLAHLNVINTLSNSVTSGQFDDDLSKSLNGLKTTKDVLVSNSTALVITIAGLVAQIKGGSTTPYEYIVPGLSIVICIVGFLGAAATNSISSDPILASLIEVFDDLKLGEEDRTKFPAQASENEIVPPNITTGMEIPNILHATPIIELQKPWYGPGPDLLYYCFTDPEYAREVAEDFIDDEGIITSWLYVKVKNNSITQTRINLKFYYRVNNETLQLLNDATLNKEDGDLLEPQSVREYWFQEWQIPKSLQTEIINGNCQIIAKVEVNGDYDSEKSILDTSILMKIPPYFTIEPINLTSSGEIQKKTYNGTEVSVVKEGDILTLSTKIKNTGGAFSGKTDLPLRWYLDDRSGELKQISKQIYKSPNINGFNYNDQIDVNFNIKTTNLGLSSFGIQGWMRNFKVALLEQDFSNCLGENIPLFSGPNKEKEKELRIEFNCYEPKLKQPKLSLNNQTPIEGQTLISRCKLENKGNGPLNLRKGDIIIRELSLNKSPLNSTDFRNSHKLELIDTDFEQTAFNNGISSLASECSKISFDFVAPKDNWIDSIEIKRISGNPKENPCGELEISYLGYKIAEFDEYDPNLGIIYLQNPILLEEGRTYHFELSDISGEIMINDGDYFDASGREILENCVITRDDGNFMYYHPKIKLYCFKSLPPQSYGSFEHIIETENKLTTKYIQWEFKSDELGIETSNEIPITIQEKIIKGFRLICDQKRKLMGYIPVVNYTVKLIKEDDVDEIDVRVTLKPPSKNSDDFLVYLKETSIPVEEFNTNLKDKTPKVFVAGIAASKNLRAGTPSSFSVIAVANNEDQEIKQEINLDFTITKDPSSIYSFTCEKNTHRLQEIYQTNYDLELVNNTNKDLNIILNATGQSITEEQKWDYLFFSNKKKTYERELGPGKKNIRFDVISKVKTEPVEIRNTIIAMYSWDPFNQENEKFRLKKKLDLMTIFEEKAHPLAITFRASPNAADPGISVKLMAQFHIFPSAEKEIYNIFMRQEGNVELLNRPPQSWQLERGKTRKIVWEVKIPENAEIGSKIPVRLIGAIAEDPRELSSIVNLDVTNIRTNYEFALKTDWRVLSVIKGKSSSLKITVENLGRKIDRIDVDLNESLPPGWYITPKRKRLGLNPDDKSSFNVSINAPPSANVGEGGMITIRGRSKGNPSLTQTKRVTVKAAPPGSNWSVLLKTKKNKRSVSIKGNATFDLTLINNGNRQLGDVKLDIKHKYHPIQFKTEVIPSKVDLRRKGATKTAKAIIEPRITGPGDYKFDIVGRWEERILYAQDEQPVIIKYSKTSFLKSRFGILTIGLGISIIIIAIILISIFSNI